MTIDTQEILALKELEVSKINLSGNPLSISGAVNISGAFSSGGNVSFFGALPVAQTSNMSGASIGALISVLSGMGLIGG